QPFAELAATGYRAVSTIAAHPAGWLHRGACALRSEREDRASRERRHMIGAKSEILTMNGISKRFSRRWRRIVIAFVVTAVVAPGRGLVVYGQEAVGGSARASQQANAPAALTLPLAVEIALRTNPLMRATASGREIADAQALEAKAGRFPLIQLSETWINGNNPAFVFGSLLEQGRFT